MTRFARLWVILATSYLVARGLLAVVVQHTIDLRFEILVQYASIPFLQAGVLAWLAGTVSPRLTVRELGCAIRKPLVAGLWCISAILLACYWLGFCSTDLTRLLLQLAGVEVMVAAFLLVSGSRACGGIALWRAAPFALLLVLLASNAGIPWFGGLPRLLPSAWPLLVRQAVLLWALLLILLALTAAATSAVRMSNRNSAFFLSATCPLAIAAALAVSLNWSFYSYPVEPWIHVFVTCVHLGAATTLTAALFLHLETRTIGADAPSAVDRDRELGVAGLWLILSLTAIAGMACLQALVYGQWNWGTTTWLLLLLPPLVQAAWLRFSREIRALAMTIREFLTEHPLVPVLIVGELIAMFWFLNSAGLDDVDGGSSRTALALYAALKIAVLGAAVVTVIRRRNLGAAVFGWLATLAGAVGVGTALSGYSILPQVVGLIFVRLALAAANRQPEGDGFQIGATDALLAPAIVLVVGDLFSSTEPLIVAAPIALSMIVLAASAATVSLQVGAAGSGRKLQ